MPRTTFKEERLLQTHRRITFSSAVYETPPTRWWNISNLPEKNSHEKLRQITLIVSRAAVSIQGRGIIGWVLDTKVQKTDLNFCGNTGQPSYAQEHLLVVAVNLGNLSLVRHLVESEGIDANARSDVFKKPLFNAASQGHLEIVQYLLSRGANADDEI